MRVSLVDTFPISGSRDYRCGETTLRFSPPASGILANGRGRSALIGDDLIPLAGIQSIGPVEVPPQMR
jgi:hypothetical protein